MIKVVKEDGTTEPYSEEKIRGSANRVGVPKALQDSLMEEIRDRLFDGIGTREIFATIKSYLKKTGAPHLAAKYNLKTALAELGPSGYPFEQFVSRLLAAIGYTTSTNQVLAGRCVTHEVDVIAKKEGQKFFVEAKFHKNITQRTDIKVALYIYARYLDLSEQAENGTSTYPWIVTNTRFSTDAISFAECRDIKVTSWGYPKGHGIMDLIEKTRLHPITILDSLTREDMRRLMESQIVTCQDLINSSVAYNLVNQTRLGEAVTQAKNICG